MSELYYKIHKSVSFFLCYFK